MAKFWDLRQAAQEKTLDLFIYSAVQADGFDWMTGEDVKSETSSDYFRNALEKAGNVEQINIYINSLGGSVVEGTAIYNQLKRHPANKTVYIDGFACSIASVIAMAGDKIVMPKNSLMMIHNMFTVVIGNAKELRKAADDLDVMSEANRQAYLLKAGDKLTEEKLVEMLDAETWLTAEQCIGYGLADEFAAADADIKKAKAQIKQALEETVQQAGGKLLAAKAPKLPDEPEKEDTGSKEAKASSEETPTPEEDSQTPADGGEETPAEESAEENQTPEKPAVTGTVKQLFEAMLKNL